MEPINNNQSKLRPDLVNLVKNQSRREKASFRSNDIDQNTNKNTAKLKDGTKLKKQRPYSCRYCEKRFINKGYWEEHKRIHTNVAPNETKRIENMRIRIIASSII